MDIQYHPPLLAMTVVLQVTTVAAALANWKMDLLALELPPTQIHIALKSAETEKTSLRKLVKTEIISMVMDAVPFALLRQDIIALVVHIQLQINVTNSHADTEPYQEDGTPLIAKIAIKLVEMDVHLHVN